MKIILKVCVFFFCLTTNFTLHSQNETKKWYFGSGAALDFVTNPPTNISSTTFSSNVNTLATVSDANGNLLFYTNGSTIWNSTHAIMSNGAGLSTSSGHHAALIIQKPNSQNLYYVFDVVPWGNTTSGLYYSIVDMNLSAGQGSVTVRSALVYLGDLCNKITGTKHCNGNDFWITTKDCSSSNTNLWDGIYSFRSYQLSSAGINTLSSISTFTYNYTAEYSNAVRIGQMKISPNGKKLACANYGFTVPYNNNVGSFEVYDFDNSTGLVSDFAPLYTTPSPGFSNASGVGVEFSPDASKLYGSLSNNYHYPNGSILQWDLCNSTNTSLATTQASVAAPTSTNNINGFTTMQLASDGKIYVSPYGQPPTSLSVINFPNAVAANSGFSLSVQSVSPGNTNFFLPNFMGSQFFVGPAVPNFTSSLVAGIVGCQTNQFQSPIQTGSTFGNCPANTYTLQNILWDFGDPGSGSNNSSSLPNPIHTYSAVGIYTVSLTLDFGCGGGAKVLTQTVNVSNPAFGNLNHSATLACNSINTGTATYVNAQSANQTYLWTNGTITYTTLFVNNLSVGTWTSLVTNTLTNCQSTTVFSISQLSTISLSISSPTVCQNSTLSINASGGTGGLSYVWSNGNTSQTGICFQTGVNTVTVSDMNSCSNSVTFTVQPVPTIVTSGSTICLGDSMTLIANGASNYSWTPGDLLGNNIRVLPSGPSIYAVSGVNQFGCKGTETLQVTVNPSPTLFLSSTHPTICIGTQANITASGAISYTWSPDSSNESTLTVSPTITTNYSLVGTNANGCKSSTNFILAVIQNPTLTVSSAVDTLCLGNTTTLTVSGATNYTWFPSSEESNNIVVSPTTPTTYSIIGETNGCKNTASILLNVIPCSKAVFGLTNAADNPMLVNSNSYRIKFTVTAVNASNLHLYNVTLNSDLSKTFPYPCTYSIVSPPVISSNGAFLMPNSSFDGLSNINLTSPTTSTLFSNTQDTLIYTVLVEPNGFSGLVKNSVIGFADTKNSLTVTDSSNNGFLWDPDNDGDPTNNNEITLIDIPLIELYIPEGFSPDGDGINDLFIVKGLNGRSAKLTVFNRWGNKVYITEGKEIIWNGRANTGSLVIGNGKLPEATYYYIFEFSDSKIAPIPGFVVLKHD